ncbi:AAA family ATPase [Marinobacter sp. G11]|uniref:AAA family ATPase n=1 Tax=Marinobacter sp. G11 TaxID=2903522 RepID=UPI001E4C1FD5|nr:AAA family ATPase [Marinobacter sp. G11]MCE0760978.1 AAA family ATPase [Marinobacter sp. G11]
MITPVEVKVRITSVGFQTRYKSSMIGVEIDDDGLRKDAKKHFLISVNRKLLPCEPAQGQVWKVRGRSSSRKVNKHGREILESRVSADSMEFVLPYGGEAFIRFVADQREFSGIGERKARKLWNEFGPKIFADIKDGKRERLRGILSEDSITALFKGFERFNALEYSEFFARHGIPQGVMQRIFRKHEGSIKQRIEEDPFRLLSFGLTWSAVDEIARKSFGVSEDSSIRLSAAIEASLLEESGRTGNTVISLDGLRKVLKKKLKTNSLVTQALGQTNFTGSFAASDKGYHPAGSLIMESVIAKRLTKRLYDTPAEPGENLIATEAFESACEEMGMGVGSGRSATEQQVNAVISSDLYYVMALSGGAGTGKTTTLGLITRTLGASGVEVHGIALSGRAAKRMGEATGIKAKTIAKFLRSPPLRPDKRSILVIDEASMLDTPTMYKIVTHVSSDVRLLFVGDVDQLPPIGPGHVLRDIIDSGVIETIQLDVVKRQKGDSAIPSYSRSIRDGVVPQDLSIGQVFFHPVDDADLNSTCIELMRADPESSMIVGATYASVHGGIDGLNLLAQETLNPDAKKWEFEVDGVRKHLKIYVNDPVIFTRNDYDSDVQNGTLGRLVSIEQQPGSYGVVQIDGGERLSVTQALLECVEPAYAISLHKAQGSQFRRVIVPLSPSKLVDRNWLYTAITRSEQELHIVGAESRFRRAIEFDSASSKRQTYLRELLIKEGKLDLAGVS